MEYNLQEYKDEKLRQTLTDAWETIRDYEQRENESFIAKIKGIFWVISFMCLFLSPLVWGIITVMKLIK